jgi:hypothetical protein
MAESSNTTGEQIARMLTDMRARTLELVDDLADEQLLGPKLRIVNPPLWEIGHVAWFQEKWALRHLRSLEPCREDIDGLYDSAAIAHDLRWDLPLPERRKTLALMQQIQQTVLDRLTPGELDDPERYFHLLSIFHEDMHAEAITYTRQTLEYPAPRLGIETLPAPEGGGPLPGDVRVPGGVLQMGAPLDAPFAFDNEKWAHPVVVPAFSIARAAVTNSEFAAFVHDGGYTAPGLRSLGAARAVPARGARQLVRGAGVLPVGWSPLADGGRVGAGCLGRAGRAGCRPGGAQPHVPLGRNRADARAGQPRMALRGTGGRGRVAGWRQSRWLPPDDRQRVGMDSR